MSGVLTKIVEPLLRRRNLFDHLTTSLLIASVVLIVTHFGATRAFDNATLLAVQRLISLGPESVSNGSVKANGFDVNTISATEYESIYSSTSPLARDILVGRIESTLESIRCEKESTTCQPMLVVDIDVSPRSVDAASYDSLDKALDAAQPKRLVVLAVPPPAISALVEQRQTLWMLDRCDHGAIFGLPYFQRDQGVVIRHTKRYPSLGNVARWGLENQRNPSATDFTTACEGVAANNPDEVCAYVRSAGTLRGVQRHFDELATHCQAEPLDFGWLSHAPSAATVNPVAFLGGDYDSRDRFNTAVGAVPGVFVHAAVFVSTAKEVSHLYAYFCETLLGVFAGFVFSVLWRLRSEWLLAYEEGLDRDASWISALKWLKPQFLLLVVLAAAIALTAGYFWCSSELLVKGNWLNPLPLVLGMMADTYISRLHKGHSPSRSKTQLLKRWLARPGEPLKCVVIIYAISILVVH